MPVSDDRFFRLEVLVRQLQRRRIVGEVTGAGAVSFGEGFTAQRTAAGKYTIRLAPPMPAANYVVHVTPISASSGTRIYAMMRTGKTVDAFNVEMLNDAGTATDSAFGFEAVRA